MLMAGTACVRQEKSVRDPAVRFEKLVFTIPPAKLSDSIRSNHKNLIPFYKAFNEEVIRIGPDSLPGYAGQLERFVNDSMISKVYAEVDKFSGQYQESCREINQALVKWASITGSASPVCLVTYLSGFNQSFITLPGLLGIGVDNYLGSDNPFYQRLGIPEYIRRTMNPPNLASDAVRAWLYSELPPPPADGGFLDRMIYEGKVYYIASKILPKSDNGRLFHYSREQLNWCRGHETAMWKYLAEQKILFSTNRLIIRKFIDEAPFTKDFGNASPGRAGIWIGYQIVSSYMKASGNDLEGLGKLTNAKEILSGSRYHP